MQHFNVGDCVLVINATYEPRIIGHVGTVERAADVVSGIDKFGCVVCGVFVVVDLPGDVNRHGTTLWYMRPAHLMKLNPDDHFEMIGVGAATPTPLPVRNDGENGPQTATERLPG